MIEASENCVWQICSRGRFVFLDQKCSAPLFVRARGTIRDLTLTGQIRYKRRMGYVAIMCFRASEKVPEDKLKTMNELLEKIPESFDGVPVSKLTNETRYEIEEDNRTLREMSNEENWYKVSLVGPYSDVSYPKPGILKYIHVAETIESIVPTVELFYGADEGFLSRFRETEREQLRQWAAQADMAE